MKIGVIGAGAIGGFFAARLAMAGHEVSVLARGATLGALRERGLRLESGGRVQDVNVRASNEPRELGPQELLLVAVKAPSFPAILAHIETMGTRETAVVPVVNGIPWWFFLSAPGPLSGYRLKSVDPLGQIERSLPMERVLGCVVFPSCSTPSPGHVRHGSGNRLVFGEACGGRSSRAEHVAALCAEAGFDAEASPNLRVQVWLKLLGNACFNPVSLITRAPTDQLIDHPRIYELFVEMMHETLAVGRAIGIAAAIEPADRIAVSRKLGTVKTSMLQDAEAGRPVEMGAILETLLDVAQVCGTSTPKLALVHALAHMHAAQNGLLAGEAGAT